MKVNQALIMAGGKGTRLGLGAKPYILYKGRILLEYVVESCISAGIENIVVILPPKDIEKALAKKKVERSQLLIQKYPWIRWVQFPKELGLGFRGAPNEVKKYFDAKKPFYLLCGQSPQSGLFLRRLGNLYKTNSIVLSGYRYRHEFFVSIGKVKGNKVTEFTNIECTNRKDFRAKADEYITHMPYIWNFEYYDSVMKRDAFKEWVEFYPNDFKKNGGNIYLLEYPIQVSEVDYKKDIPALFRSIELLQEKKYLL